MPAASKRLTASQIKMKQFRTQKSTDEQKFQNDISDLFEPTTKAVEDTSEKMLKHSKATNEAIDKIDENCLTKTPAENKNKTITNLNPNLSNTNEKIKK